MKKLGLLLMLVSLGVFSLGCAPKPKDAGTTAPPADGAEADHDHAEGEDHEHAEGEKGGAEGDGAVVEEETEIDITEEPAGEGE